MKSASNISGILVLTLFPIVVLLSACSELKTDLPSPTSAGVKVHPTGWLSKTSDDFHGKSIRAQNWEMKPCQVCHGKNYEGGTVGESCTSCHSQPAGPENCVTCHGSTNAAPPRDLDGKTAKTDRGVGAHQIHLLGSSLSADILCSECHVVPPGVSSSGHLDGTPRAEVVFSNTLTNTRTTGVVPSPTYDPAPFKCANTYCHGNFKNGNSNFVPVWNDASGSQMACGTCHGDVTKATLAERALPKTSAQGGTHVNVTTCSACHGDVVDANLRIISPAKHVNGKLSVFGQERDF